MRKIRQPPPIQGEDRLIPFLASLVAEDLSPKSVDGYRQDLLAFRRWYREFPSPRWGLARRGLPSS